MEAESAKDTASVRMLESAMWRVVAEPMQKPLWRVPGIGCVDQMMVFPIFPPFKVGNGPRDFEDSAAGADGQSERTHALVRERMTGGIRPGIHFNAPGFHLSVRVKTLRRPPIELKLLAPVTRCHKTTGFSTVSSERDLSYST